MKSRKLMYPQALVVLATLVIHVGLAAQETKLARPQNQVSLFSEPLLAEFAISTGAEFALTVDHSLSGTEGRSGPDVTLSATLVTFYCFERGGLCACRQAAPVATAKSTRKSALLPAVLHARPRLWKPWQAGSQCPEQKPPKHLPRFGLGFFFLAKSLAFTIGMRIGISRLRY
jgi:hypothetical protein